uniref:DUF2158 domain-containing protein n=1 Tax=Aeromonas allosaccharophila TaxID=656 RepID=UPI002B4A96C4
MFSYTNVTSGDVVTLRSSEQQMTVKAAVYDEMSPDLERVVAHCTWFNKELGGLPVEYAFDTKLLELKDESPYARQHTRFVLGQVVKLRSGGPLMTIAGFDKTGDVRGLFCVWLDEGVVSQINHQATTAPAPGDRYTRGFL